MANFNHREFEYDKEEKQTLSIPEDYLTKVRFSLQKMSFAF